MTTETTESQPGTALYIDRSISPAQQYETMESSAQQYETESDKYIAGSRTYPGPQPYKLGCSGSRFHLLLLHQGLFPSCTLSLCSHKERRPLHLGHAPGICLSLPHLRLYHRPGPCPPYLFASSPMLVTLLSVPFLNNQTFSTD